MNFWRNKSLSVQAIFILTMLAIVAVAQFFLIRYSLSSLTEAERKIDFARNVQVENQRIAIQTLLYKQGNKTIAAELKSSLDHQDHLLTILRDGGRIDGTRRFLKPLSRLPRMTFDNLHINWNTYKSAVSTLVTSGLPEQEIDVKPVEADTNDIHVPEPIITANNEQFDYAELIVESNWLSLSRWYDRLINDLVEEVDKREITVLTWFSLFILVDIAGFALLFFLFKRHVLSPLKTLETNTASQTHTLEIAANEVGVLAHHINNTVEDLRDATDFVIAIGEGKLDLDYKTLDVNYNPGKNKLADSLIEMQSRLKSMSDEEQKRQWSNEGLAKFVDILRSSNDDLILLGDKIIAALVHYTKANQGGLYILNDEDGQNKHLELISLFAFDIKKYEQQKIKLGEGILGQTFLEKETTHLTDLPESFVRITSGLGDSNPTSVLMVPLKVDTQVYGIIELASFHAFMPHEIAFVEKLGESIASTLASVRGAQKNRQLIEQFQEQTEQMRAQEEEMRQNMEELQATQEEIARKEKSYIERIRELEELKGNSISTSELENHKAQSIRKEQEFQATIDVLKKQLLEKPAHGEDWELAKEVEKTLKINLEALEITQAELTRKTSR